MELGKRNGSRELRKSRLGRHQSSEQAISQGEGRPFGGKRINGNGYL